jgi:hypothetical protein
MIKVQVKSGRSGKGQGGQGKVREVSNSDKFRLNVSNISIRN